MGKASRKKRQEEFQAESALKDKPLKSSETSSKWGLLNKPLHIFLITIVGLLAYSNTFNAPFHFDDANNIVENYKLKDLSNFWPPSGSRWFGFLTFALNYHSGGLNTTGYHIFNLTIHILNAILVYWLVMLTFRTPYFKVSVISAGVSNQPNQFNLPTFKPLNYLPLFIALLFVAHPIQTQAVTYIVQRFTSLATMFYLLSLVMYIKFRSQQSAISGQQKLHAARYTLYAVSLLSAILAMKTKEISFTLPIVITLYEFMFFDGKIKKRLLYLIPILLTMLIIPLTIMGVDKPVGVLIGDVSEATRVQTAMSRWDYLFTQFRVIVTYVRLLFMPINQNLDYDYPIYDSFFDPNVFLSFLFLLSIFGIGIYLLYRSRISHHEQRDKILPLNQVQGQNDKRGYQNDRKRRNDINIPTRYTLHPTPYPLYATRLMAFGILWFFITLSVESSIIPIFDVIFEHRVYLPSVGIFIAITTSVFILASKLKRKWPQIGKTVTPVLALIIIILSGATYARNIVWQDEMSLWEDVVRKSPNKARGYNNLGAWGYSKRGWVDKAVQVYQTALRLKPDYAEAHHNLGIAYKNKGWIDKAIEHYRVALGLNPDYTEAYNSLGSAYYDKGWVDKAIEYYQIALKLKPNFGAAHYNLCIVCRNKGWIDEAIEHCHIVLRLKPDYAEAHYLLGIAYSDKGWVDEAIEHYQAALRLKPDYVEAHGNLGFVYYYYKGWIDKAIEHYQVALRLNPNNANTHLSIGIAYKAKGWTDKAMEHFGIARRLNPALYKTNNVNQ